MKQRLYVNVCIFFWAEEEEVYRKEGSLNTQGNDGMFQKGLLLRQKYAGLRRGRIKRPFNKISLMCNTDPFVPNRIHLTETEIAHMPRMGCAQSEKTSRTESLAQNFCRKKQIPTNGYSCSLHNWFVFHGIHSSAHSPVPLCLL